MPIVTTNSQQCPDNFQTLYIASTEHSQILNHSLILVHGTIYRTCTCTRLSLP